jgi:BASS family bile acid:Na+ symporter
MPRTPGALRCAAPSLRVSWAMDVQQALGLAFRIMVVTTMFAAGLDTSASELRTTLRRRGLIARSILAMMIVTPLVAIVLAKLMPIGAATRIAIVVGAISPGLPTLPRRGGALAQNKAYATTLEAISAVLAVGLVPAWLAVLGPLFGVELDVTLGTIALTLGAVLIAPLALGMAIRRWLPARAARMAGPVSQLSAGLVPGLALVVLLLGAAAIVDLPWLAVAAMLLVIGIGLAVGHWLGGPEPRDRTVLAIANTGRFPVLAALVATALGEPRAIPVIILYTLLSVLATMPYQAWRKRMHRVQGPARA